MSKAFVVLKQCAT